MEARDIMRENLNKDFLYFSPIGATLDLERKAYRLVESNYMSTMGALNAAILRQKNLEMTSASFKNHESAPVSTDLLPHQCTHDYTCIHTGDFTFHHWLFSDYRNIGPYPQTQIRAERITGGTVIGAYPRESKLRYRRYNKAINKMAVWNAEYRFTAVI